MWGYIFNFLSSWTNSENKSMDKSTNAFNNTNSNFEYSEIMRENVQKIENCYYTYHKKNLFNKWKENVKKELLDEINKIKYP